jgi:Ca2+-binding RTX toxin-like protein
MANLRTIKSTGSSSNRVDMIFLGDGYQANEISTKFNQHVQSYINYLFSTTALTDPFSRYKNFFNIHVIDVISQQSGADDPSRGITVNTALNARYFFDGVTERLMSIDNNLADNILNAALAGSNIGNEIRYVTVNETKYGGAGGPYSVFAGGNTFAHEVALHENGHSFAGLTDEYGGAGLYTGAEPDYINVSKDPSGNKWREWLGYVDPNLGTVGAYEGGFYHDSGIFRPTDKSKMNVLENPFDPIAREAFIHKFYSLVDPLDSHTNNTGTKTNLKLLVADTIDPKVISVDWTVNGKKFVKAGEKFSLIDNDFGFGTYTVTARAYDPTLWVRGDRSDLEESVTWTIKNDYRLAGTTKSETLTGNNNAQQILGRSGNDTLNAAGGNDTLSGNAGADKLLGGTGKDTASYSSDGAVTVALDKSLKATGAAAGDTFSSIENLTGSTANDRLGGNSIANVINGSAGNDRISAKSGNDTVIGGTGKDTLTGGRGADKFQYTKSTHGGDKIADFGSSDFFVFEGSAFKLGTFSGQLKSAHFESRKSGHLADDKNDYFIFDESVDQLWFDANGNGTGGATMIADINSVSLLASDILII